MSLGVMLVLATTFVLAALAKLRDRAAFEQVIAVIAGRAAARPLAFAVPVAELGLAGALLAGPQPRAVALLALAVLVAFSWALVRLRAQPEIPSCNCFGSSAGDPGRGLVRNAALGVLAVALVIAPHAGAPWTYAPADVVAAATVALGAACAWHLAGALVPVRQAVR
ncbi:MAG: MauE/DoxX family redox-associated membrane protein [Solirubrobacteraceae bacterium]